ncbi:MAG TPA: glycerate kinase [Fusobacteriaceae bacterium]|nr:glycerate kinase [Fusobacteriaceae bacterium]
MKILIAIDSFKGSLSSNELANRIENGIKKVYKNADIIKVPVADGGEGTIEALVEGTKGHFVEITVSNPILVPIKAKYGILGDQKTAVIEMATASGLPLVPIDKRNPMETTTFGTGEMIKDAISKGCREFLIGIGGSATNDGGIGMMKALGVKFYDENNIELGHGGKQLPKIKKIDISGLLPELKESKFLVACDVDNPFYGLNGAAHVYGKQKGADNEMILELDKGLKDFSETIKKIINKDISNIPGAGAAGGLGGGFLAFLNSQLKSGIDIVLEEVKLKEKLVDVDFVITGEGRMDLQSIMGKAPVGVAKLAKQYDIPVIALAGGIADDAGEIHNHGIDSMFSIMNYPVTLEEAMNPKRAGSLVEKNIEEIFRLIKVIKK